MQQSVNLSDAVALIPRYDDTGKLYTIIVKKTHLQKSNICPTKVIDNHLRKNGSSLRGAKDAASFIMGTASMHPFLVQTYPDIHVWFPSESPRKQTCAYLCLHQIAHYDAYLGSETETIIYLYGAFAIIIPVAKSKFEARFREAHCFQSKAYCYRTFAYECNVRERQILQCAEMHVNYLV